MAKILVTDGRQRSTLAVVRSLGKMGIDVTVGEDQFPCLASRSKYCYDTFKYESAASNPPVFVDDLVNELQRNNYDMVMPMTDITTYLVMENIDKLSALTKIPVVDRESYLLAIDKGEVIRLCQNLNVPVPKTYFIESIDEIKELAQEFSFPIVIKPRRSKYLTNSGWIEHTVDYALNLDDLLRKVERFDSSSPLPVLQERIKGPGLGAFLLFNHGKTKAIFFHKRLREKPPSGGVSVLRESAPAYPAMRDYAVRILKALDWHGVAMVEFKLDERDSLPKVMEINARFWGSLQLAIDSGVDFPYMVFRMTTEGDVNPVFEYKTGAKSRWLLGDMDHLLARVFKPESKLKLQEGYPGRLATLLEFVKFYQTNMKYEVLKFDDLRPFLIEFREYIWQISKALITGILKRRHSDELIG